MVLPVMAALTACSDDDKYTPAQALSNAQVFFASDIPSSVKLAEDQTSFDVKINRVKTDGELTVALTSTQDTASTAQVTVPGSVTFADGEKEAVITVTYDPTTIDYDDVNKVNISIADAEYATPYGITTYAFEASMPAPWTPWIATKAAWVSAGYDAAEWPLSESESTCTYTYTSCPFSALKGPDPGLPILYRKSLNDPTKAQFWIQHWAFNVDLYLDYNPETHNIVVPMNYIGADDEDLGSFYMTDVSGWQQADFYSRGYPCTYDPESGKFVLNVAYVTAELACYGYGEETIQVDGFYVPDYSAVPTFEGVLTKDDLPYAQVTMEFGADVQKVLGYIVEKGADKDAVADALAAGDVEGVELVAGINNLPIGDLTGELLLVVASVVDGEVAYHDAVSFGYYGGGKSPWTALGTGYFTDDMILPLFGYEADDYPVEIEESTETPGVYRLLAMYSAVAADFGVESGTGDVIVNAEDPDAVYILPQPLELTLGSNGPFSISTDAGEYVAEYGFEAVKAQLPEIFATLKDGVISFPVLTDEREDGSTMNYQLWAVMNGKYYYAGRAGQFKIVLPEAAAEVKAKAASAARAKSFRARLTAKSGYKRADMRKKMGKSMKMSHRKPALNKGFKAKTL